MLRALRHRDRGCTFPGCGAKRLLQAHHIRHWIGDAGPTEIPNLVLVCSFHHRLVHEHGWRVSLDRSGVTTWCRPGGRPYDPTRTGPFRARPAYRGAVIDRAGA